MPRLLHPLAVLALGLVLFAGSLTNPLTSDDIRVTVESPQTYEPANIPKYFFHDLDWMVPEEVVAQRKQPSRFGLYRPILVATFVINALLFDFDPFGWRLTNLLLHLVASLLF